MPPKIALSICIVFILYLFKIDSKCESYVSRALWIPLIWMMIVGSRMPALWLNPAGMVSPEAYLEGNPLNRNIFIILIVTGIFILSRRKIDWSQILKNNMWIFLLFLYGGVSILWSDFPSVSFKRWIKAIGNPIMVLIVLTSPAPVEAVKTMFRRCAYVLIPLSIVLYKYYPLLGRVYHRYSGELFVTGVTTNKNSLGLLCLVLGLFFFWNLLTLWRSKKVYTDKREILVHVTLLFMILWLLVVADSATSTMLFILGICIMLGFELPFIKENIQCKLRFLIIVSLCLTPFLLFGFSSWLSSVVNITGHTATFWGRVQLWPEFIGLMGASHLIGTGYDSFWLGHRIATLWAKYWWHPTEAHNGYVETYLNLGLIGLFLLLGVIISAYRKICRTLMSDFNYGRLKMVFIVIALLYNVTEAAFKGLHLMWFVFLLIAIRVPVPIAVSDSMRN